MAGSCSLCRVQSSREVHSVFSRSFLSLETPSVAWTGRQPRSVHAYVEISPLDLVKYEIHRITGYMRVGRTHRTAPQPSTSYGFIRRTYCRRRVHGLPPDA